MTDFTILQERDLFRVIEDVKFSDGVFPRNGVGFNLCLNKGSLSLYLSNNSKALPKGVKSENFYGECTIDLDEMLPRDFRIPHRYAVDFDILDGHENAYDLVVAAILTRQCRLEVSGVKKDCRVKFELHISGFVTEGFIEPDKVANLICIDEDEMEEDDEEEDELVYP